MKPNSTLALAFIARFIVVLGFLSAVGLQARAAVTWAERFDDAAVEERWAATRGIWQIGKPTFGVTNAYSAPNLAATVLDGQYPENVESRLELITRVRVPDGPNPRLRFRQWHEFSTADYGMVQIRPTGGTWESISTNTWSTSGGWEFESLDVSKYAGQSVQIGFLFHSATTSDYVRVYTHVGAGWYIDDLELFTGEMTFQNPEGFERTDALDHWVVDNGIWQVGAPTSGPKAAFSGTQVAATILDGNYAENYESRLISPPVTVPSGANPRLRFRQWHEFSTADYGMVQIRPSGGTWESISTNTWSTSGGWEFESLDVSKYAGQSVQIGFLFHSATTSDYVRVYTHVGAGWYIDDLELFSGEMLLQNPDGFERSDIWDHWVADNGIWQVGVPTSGPQAAFSGIQVAATILDGNYAENYESRLISPPVTVPSGANPRLRFRQWHEFSTADYGMVQIRPSGGTWESISTNTRSTSGGWEFESLDVSKYAGQSVQIGFLFHSATTSDYVRVYTHVGAGWYIDDLELFSGEMLLQNPDGFERSDIWDHWVADNGIWQVGVPTSGPQAAFSGTKVAATILDGNYVDDYESRLISPPVVVPNEPNPRLRFRQWHEFSTADYGMVQIRPSGGTWESISTNTWSTSGGWEFESLDVSKYAGQSVQIGFLFHSATTSDYVRVYTHVGAGWYIDDLELFSGEMLLQNPDGFERSDIWDHWVVDNGIWQVGVPTSGPQAAFSGTNVAATILGSDYADGYESKLIGPKISIPPGGNAALRFRHWYGFNTADYGAVMVRRTGGDWMQLENGYYEGDGSTWSYTYFPLGKYEGQEVQLGFHFHSATTRDHVRTYTHVGPGWYIDDVRIVVDALAMECGPIIVIAEGDPLNCRISSYLSKLEMRLAPGAPDGMRLDPVLGLLLWLPSESQSPSTNIVRVQLIDPSSNLHPLDEETLTIVVTERNQRPQASLLPPLQIRAGQELQLPLDDLAFDQDVPTQMLSFTLGECAPAGAAIDPVKRALVWTPTAEQVGTVTQICLVATDSGTPPLSTNFVVLIDAPQQRMGISRRADGGLELDAGGLPIGTKVVLESADHVSKSMSWRSVVTNDWRGAAIVIQPTKPQEFFRLRIE